MNRTERPARRPDADVTRYLVVDNRFPIPITILLDLDPTAEPGFPGFAVREVTLEPDVQPENQGISARDAIGRDPARLDRFRSFPSERAVARAGFILIEPRYVGPNWPAYILAFKPGGEKPQRR
ncbi:MAG TPA: hypothetical protein VH092_05400 [Urbifossiella sp.]|jgi:hypothetical protein|nr:hypothetical protein [Urbifossiella sp.]